MWTAPKILALSASSFHSPSTYFMFPTVVLAPSLELIVALNGGPLLFPLSFTSPDVLLEPRNGAPLRPRVKLTDFGLAKVIEQGSPLLTTRCGSEDYAAPEIILGQPYDGRQADIWSLGVVLYALLVGFLPFNMRPGMRRKSFLSMIAHAEFGFPGERVPIKRTSQSNLYATIQAQAQGQGQGQGQASTESKDNTGTLLPAANDAVLSADPTMIVPKMSGVGPVSAESKELVRWLLQTQGARRPTARELWAHPWVAAGRAVHNST